jgi:mannose-1-phosphate guanylyltransferase
MALHALVMSGGVGSRLWPLSRELYPKQLLNLHSASSSLLQDTLQRLRDLPLQDSYVICNAEHRFLVADQVKNFAIQPENILLEPVGRNTAPAIAVSAFEIYAKDPDAVLLVLAADHVIQNEAAFTAAVRVALNAAQDGNLVTFGIVPDKAETGYGYIRKGAAVNGVFAVDAFVEKPDAKTAEQYLQSGEYLWNSGMFLFRADAYLAELKTFAPAIYDACAAAHQSAKREYGFINLNPEAFLACPEDSIDYAVMEKTKKALVVPMDAGWSDVGSWSALWELAEKDANQNTLIGDVLSIDSRGNYVRSADRLVATVGVDDLLIVDTKDALLIAPKNRAQDVKKIVNELNRQGREETKIHARATRPWGTYETIDQDDRFKVKRIIVNPGAKLSLQMHHHRAEHWIVVKGTALVTRGEEQFMVSENQSTYIPLGEKHRLENPGRIPLEMVEVQSGAYLEEDDIVRFSDQYGR